MMRARTEFSLKNADDIFNPKIETKNKKRSQKRKEIDNGQIYEVLCVCVCAVLKVGELLPSWRNTLYAYILYTYLKKEFRAIASLRRIKNSPIKWRHKVGRYHTYTYVYIYILYTIQSRLGFNNSKWVARGISRETSLSKNRNHVTFWQIRKKLNTVSTLNGGRG